MQPRPYRGFTSRHWLDGRFISSSESITHLLGYSSEEVSGQRIFDVIHDADVTYLVRLLTECKWKIFHKIHHKNTSCKFCFSVYNGRIGQGEVACRFTTESGDLRHYWMELKLEFDDEEKNAISFVSVNTFLW